MRVRPCSMLRARASWAACGGRRVAQRREDIGRLASEAQIPADSESDKSLRVTEGEKGHFRLCKTCWEKAAGSQIVKKGWSRPTAGGQFGRLTQCGGE